MISFPSKYQKTELCSTPCCFAGCFAIEVAGNVEKGEPSPLLGQGLDIS
jgi:hypothetical protein